MHQSSDESSLKLDLAISGLTFTLPSGYINLLDHEVETPETLLPYTRLARAQGLKVVAAKVTPSGIHTFEATSTPAPGAMNRRTAELVLGFMARPRLFSPPVARITDIQLLKIAGIDCARAETESVASGSTTKVLVYLMSCGRDLIAAQFGCPPERWSTTVQLFDSTARETKGLKKCHSDFGYYLGWRVGYFLRNLR